MDAKLQAAGAKFIQAMSQISSFWGFPKAMGAIYGAVYLSPRPITLDALVELVGVSKGAVSTNVRKLERLQMVHKEVKIGDRKDYYVAETNFWRVVQAILQERQNRQFDQALRAVDESLQMVSAASEDDDLSRFYQQRISRMQSFFSTFDKIVTAIAALDEFRLSTLHKILGRPDT
ncbi:MAG: hypothetical protein GXP37_09950 [Chloroflexi bacterium]|nr:hypothetical protein [Chloroflexota bacterium]